MRPERNAPGEPQGAPESILANAWITRFGERAERLAERGIAYRHLLVPGGDDTPLRRALVDAGIGAVPGVLGFDAPPGRMPLERALDVAETTLARALGLADRLPAGTRPRARRRYANRLVRHAELAGRLDDPRLQTGSHVIHDNDSPDASPLRVVVFGGAFVDRGADRLGGRLAERVRELHVVWSADLDHELIAQVRPDVVVTVLATGAMVRVPRDAFDLPRVAAARLAADRERIDAGDDVGGAANAPPVERRLVLERESYRLEPPIVVQPGRDVTLHEPLMRTNDVHRVDVPDARVHFDGTHALVVAPDGETVLRRNVDAARLERARDEHHRPVPGTTLLLGDSSGAHCYYHWMMDVLPRLGLLERDGVDLDGIDTFLVREIVADFQLETLARFGIGRERVLETVNDPWLRCERLIHHEIRHGINLTMNRFVPQWLKHAWPPREPVGRPLKLYVGRPPGVRRGVANEAAMRPLLEAAGFTCVVMEGLSVAEQAALLARADALIAPHGGALTNMVFCRPGIPVVELLSRHVYPYYYGLAAMCGHRYHAILENSAEDYGRLVSRRVAQAHAAPERQWRTHDLAFDVPLDALERVLARLGGARS